MSSDQPPPPPGHGPGPGPGPGPGSGPRSGPGGPPERYAPEAYEPYPPSPYGVSVPNPYAAQPYRAPAPPPEEARGPRGGGSREKVVGLAVLSVAVALALVGGATVLLNRGDGDASGGGTGTGGGGDAARRYRLTTPATIAQSWQRQGEGKDDSALGLKERVALGQLPGLTDPHAVQADYASGTGKSMEFAGVYGTIADPGQAVSSVLLLLGQALTAEGRGTGTAQGEPTPLRPAGVAGDVVVRCQLYKVTGGTSGTGGATASVPVCAWGDTSTLGVVVYVDPLTAVTGSTSVDDAAALTGRVWQESRVPVEAN